MGTRRQGRKFVFWIVCIIAPGIFVFFQNTSQGPVISPIPDDPKPSSSIFTIFTPKKDPRVLKQKIQEAVGSAWHNYSVHIVDYTSDFSLSINETEVFSAASVNKVPILAALYYQAQQGVVDFDKQITPQAADIQDYGTGSIRYDPPGTTYSVKTLARLMSQKSDNTAAFLLANYVVGIDTIQKLVANWGLSQTDMIENKTSNKDMETIIKKMYDGKIANPALTAEMLGFLKDSDFEDRLPALLPKDATVYHKIGTTEGGIHDAGIVKHGKKMYYIGIFTADVVNEEEAVKLLAKISKVVFDYVN